MLRMIPIDVKIPATVHYLIKLAGRPLTSAAGVVATEFRKTSCKHRRWHAIPCALKLTALRNHSEITVSMRNDVLALATRTAGRRRSPSESSSRLMRCLACGAIIATCAGMVRMVVAADTVQHKVLTLSVVNGAVAGVGDTVKVQQGDDLELRWSSDKPMQLHLHGYDIEIKVSPQAPAVMSFKANIPGRFPVEAHGQAPGHHRPVLYLEVHP